MRGIPDVSHVRGKISGSDKDAINSVHRSDRLDFLKRGAGFNLHQHAHFFLRSAMIVRHSPKFISTRGRGKTTTSSKLRKTSCGHSLAGFICVLDERDQKCLNSYIKVPLDQHCVIPGNPHDWSCGSTD